LFAGEGIGNATSIGEEVKHMDVKRFKKLAALLAAGALFVAAPTALAGQGNGVSHSHGANAHGNAVSSGATPQPQ